MSKLINCRLSRIDSSPWGFRLQGGKDFGTPLIVQKVHGNSLAEKAGLAAGDAIVRVNGTDVYNLKHKEAQDVIVRAGNSFELTVSRGGSTWKPNVTVLNNKPVNGDGHYVGPVTKTSLEYHQNSGDSQEFCSGHNSVPKPFSPVNQMNGTIDRKKLMNKQYNSPVPLYSDKTIAETLSAQAEVLETGALGVNFKKNERSYDSTNSEVYKMVQEEYQYQDKEFDESSRNLHHYNNNINHYTNNVPGVRPVLAPETKFIPTSSSIPTNHINANTQLPPGQNICADCERLIVGVFVRIKDKNLHVECFKCATCGSSLKNVGYYNINDKLYCDVHAKMIARSNPPAPNLIPITISPYDKSASNMVENIKSSARSTQSPGSTSPSSVYSSSYQQTKYSSSTLPRNQNVNNCSSMNNSNMCYQNQNSSSTVTKSYSHTSSLQKGSTISSRTSGLGTGIGTGSNNISCSTGRQSGAVGSAPKRGKGVFNANIGPGARTPQCAHCRSFIRGPFISALGKIWCPEHFTCTTPSCKRQLQDLGFVEDNGQLYCEFCFEQYLAPSCAKCRGKIKGDCLKAIGKHFHPECFACTHCGRQFGNSSFFLEDNLPYCENDWNQLFTTKCFSCGFPVEAGDRWVEALGNNYHSQCFNCTTCKKNLEGQSFFAKSGRPYCKQHAH